MKETRRASNQTRTIAFNEAIQSKLYSSTNKTRRTTKTDQKTTKSKNKKKENLKHENNETDFHFFFFVS